MTSLANIIDTFGSHFDQPRIDRIEPVNQLIYRLSEATLAESAGIVKENPELAREMGVVE